MTDHPENLTTDAERQRARSRYGVHWEEMPCYLSVHDPSFRVIDGNRRFREDFGDRIGDFCYEVYKGRQEVCPECPVEVTFADGESHGAEQILKTRHGKDVPVMAHTTPIRDENGEIIAVMEMHTDISEVKRLQDLLQESRDRLTTMFEEVPCYIAVLGPDMIIRHANRRLRETFGPAVGNHCYKVYRHRDEPCLVCQAQQTFTDGKTRDHELVVVTDAGEKINVISTTAPIRNADGEVEAVIEMSTDISQIRQLQSQLASIGLLVGSISHGIKGLLTGLDGGIYLVNSGFEKEKPDRVKRGWEMVQRNVDRIRSMVLDILYYAKDRELTLADIEAAYMVDKVKEALEKKAGDLDVEMEIDIAPDAGSFPGDFLAVRATLLNILENSFDACRSDREKTDHLVKFRARREPPWMVFEIADNGIGMDQETRDRMFSLFFSSKGLRGTGLGLFISNKIVDKHGGTIEVESELGKGSRFAIRIPLEAKPSTKPAEA